MNREKLQTRLKRRSAVLSAAILVLSAGVLPAPNLANAQLTTPTDWRWVLDEPAKLVTGDKLPDGSWYFVSMPPGFHITTGPGVLVFNPAYQAQGRFSLDAEIFLFPGESQEEYGLFFGGEGLETGDMDYTAFVARRDGSAAVFSHHAGQVKFILPWTRNEAVLPHSGSGTVKNKLRVDVEAQGFVFSVNEKVVGEMDRDGLSSDGRFGFRVGTDVNLHISTLDLNLRLAPPAMQQEN